MMPSRPWPRIVRGRTIVTSRPAADRVAAQQLGLELGPPVRLERPAGRRPRSTGLRSGMPKIALDDVCTTLATPASRAATSTFAVPTTLTDQNSSRSLASGTWATLWSTTSTPSHGRRAPRRGRGRRPATNSTPSATRRRAGSGRRSRTSVAARQRPARPGRVPKYPLPPVTRTRRGPSERDRRARGTSGCSPACRRAGSSAGRSRARAGPGLMSHGDRVLQLAEHVHGLHVAARGLQRRASSLLGDDADERGARAAARADGSEPLGVERVAHGRRRRRAARRARRRRSSTPGPRRAGDASASSRPCDEVAGVHHRPAVACRRRRAGTGPRRMRGEEPASAARAGTGRRTTAPAR